LRYHWHPVCRESELPGPVAVRLLGEDLAVARLGRSGKADAAASTGRGDHVGGAGADGQVVALADRCPHRSTRLSVGTVDGGCLRCAYHGWAFGVDGQCVEIPSLPDAPIPGRAATPAHAATVAYGLVWVCLDSSAGTVLPACPAFDDPRMKILAGEPYTWPVSAPRRVENFVDLAHFAFVHDGSLGRRDQPVPPIPEVRRTGSELRFAYDPSAAEALPEETADAALVAPSAYRMPMPCTVDIEFLYPAGVRRRLWMTASPIDDATCRSFWYLGRTDDLAGDDRDHLAFQGQVIAEDEPVVTNQVPAEILLDPAAEVSVRTDKVSIEYRRWLRELATAALSGPAPYRAALALATAAPDSLTTVSG
jgi:vanillate O-demethylase monooxygenase subunit